MNPPHKLITDRGYEPPLRNVLSVYPGCGWEPHLPTQRKHLALPAPGKNLCCLTSETLLGLQVNFPRTRGRGGGASTRLGSNGAGQASMPPFPEDKKRSGRAQDSGEQGAGSLRLTLKRQRGSRSQGNSEVKHTNCITRLPWTLRWVLTSLLSDHQPVTEPLSAWRKDENSNDVMKLQPDRLVVSINRVYIWMA